MELDHYAHKVYGTSNLIRRPTGALCRNCGATLDAAYHENRLYSVACTRCQTVTLVKARNPHDAAGKAGLIPEYNEEE